MQYRIYVKVAKVTRLIKCNTLGMWHYKNLSVLKGQSWEWPLIKYQCKWMKVGCYIKQLLWWGVTGCDRVFGCFLGTLKCLMGGFVVCIGGLGWGFCEVLLFMMFVFGYCGYMSSLCGVLYNLLKFWLFCLVLIWIRIRGKRRWVFYSSF